MPAVAKRREERKKSGTVRILKRENATKDVIYKGLGWGGGLDRMCVNP